MNPFHVLHSIEWKWVTWALLAGAAGTGLVAVVSPRLFATLNAWSGVWVDVDRFSKGLDRRIDIEHHVIRHIRLLGAMTTLAACVLAAASLRFQYGGQWIALVSLGLVSVTGLLGLFSPRLFSRLARWGSLWVDADRLVEKMERRIDVDRHVLRHCRWFGIAVLAAVAVLAGFLL